MKRYGNLYGEITSFENLLSAAKRAQRGKRYREPVLAFNAELEGNLLRLQRELRHQIYEPGAYRSEEHTSELQSLTNLVCRLLLEKKKNEKKKKKKIKKKKKYRPQGHQ